MEWSGASLWGEVMGKNQAIIMLKNMVNTCFDRSLVLGGHLGEASANSHKRLAQAHPNPTCAVEDWRIITYDGSMGLNEVTGRPDAVRCHAGACRTQRGTNR